MRKIAFILAVITAVFCLVACSGGKEEETTKEPVSTGATGATVKDIACSVITMDEKGFKTRIVEVIYGTVTNEDGRDVTVLDAVKKLFDENDVKYSVENDRIISIRGKEENVSDGYEYIWEFKINGHEITTPANETLVGEEDHIIYYLTPHKQ